MKRWALALLALSACDTAIQVDPEGLKCDLSNPCPAGFICVGGVCRNQVTCANNACATDGGDRCQGVSCSTPPAAFCVNSSTLRTFASGGTCNSADGSCSYSSSDVTCAKGCANNACSGEPCTGVSCTTPPAPFCVNATTLRTYAPSGTCQGSICSYSFNDTGCANGCQSNQCVNQNLCQGVVCNTPPPSTCLAGRVRTYNSPGTCQPSTGQCSYTFTETSCNGTCQGNLCVPAGLTFTQTGPKVRHAVNAVDQAPLSSGGHVLAVGPLGKVSKWNGTNWTELGSPTNSNLNGVWLSSSGSGWIVGQGKTLLRYNGSTLTSAPPGPGPGGASLVSVHGRTDSHVLLADDAGGYWRWNGSSWSYGSVSSSVSFRGAAVFVNDIDNERIAGLCVSATPRGCVAYASSLTGTWYTDQDSSTSDAFRAVGPSVSTGSGAAFTGRSTAPAVRRHLSAGSFDATQVPAGMSGGHIAGITEAPYMSGKAAYVLTGRGGAGVGRLYRFTSNGFDPNGPLLDLYLGGGAGGGGQCLSRNESGGVIVADSGPNSASIFRRGVLTNEVLDLGEHWQAAAFSPGGSLYLMNQDGDLAVRMAGQSAFSFRRSPTTGMYGLAAGLTYSLVVGSGGDVYRVTAGGYALLTSNTTSNLNALCRVSDTELYIVGDSGVIRSCNGSTVSPMTSPTGASLRSVHCAGPQSAVACGSGGTVLRLSGGNWAPVSPPYPNPAASLSSCWLTSSGTIYVAGDNVFARLEGGSWTQLPARASLEALQVFGPAEAYAISNGTEVVRFDGSGWTSRLTAPWPLWGGTSATGRAIFVGDNGVVVEGQ
ncbi:MAG: hypothetical protein HYZ28_11420 [Myxococcales bacterium]|nr:hypothetical protein [Myxococcales bacterium]